MAGARPGREGHPAAARCLRFFAFVLGLASLPVFSQNAQLMPAIGAIRMGDFVQAIDTLRPIAAKGDPEAQFLLGVALETAPPPQHDLKGALEWYQRAAQEGHAGALNNLGSMHYDGRGVGKDPEAAFRFYGAAAEKRHPQALYNLALMYGLGVGVRRDYREMAKWLTLAANAGVVGAQAQLGVSYQRGMGVQRNLETAHDWFLMAAKGGYKPAMRELAKIYEMGLGVPSDDAKAKLWAERGK